MSLKRKTTIDGHLIEEFYWAGEWPCYVDRRLAAVGYDDAVHLAARGEPIPLKQS